MYAALVAMQGYADYFTKKILMNFIITDLAITEDHSETQKPPKSLDLFLKIRLVSNGDFSGFLLEDNSIDEVKICFAILQGLIEIKSPNAA